LNRFTGPQQFGNFHVLNTSPECIRTIVHLHTVEFSLEFITCMLSLASVVRYSLLRLCCAPFSKHVSCSDCYDISSNNDISSGKGTQGAVSASAAAEL